MFLLVLVILIISSTTFNAQDSYEALISEIWANEESSSTKGCYCVPYYLCLDNGTVNTAGIGVIDVRIDDYSFEEEECESFMDVCCLADTIVDKVPEEYPAREMGCGYSNPDGVNTTFNASDDVTKFGEIPWMIGILTSDLNNPEDDLYYECGGALIHPQVVLTAAHCVPNLDKNSVTIRAGEWDSRGIGHVLPHQDSYLKSVVVHPEYYEGALFNDIALLFLETPFKISGNVDVVCLPPQGYNFDNAQCLATGWGKEDYGESASYQAILKKVQLPVVPHKPCEHALKKTRLGHVFRLHESFICAGGEVGKDTCKGDGGSPLICPIEGYKDRYYQAGIVSWGIGCNNAIPAAYVNVAHFRNWIDQELRIRGIQIEDV